MKIIFKNEDNSIGIITPTSEALSLYNISEIAKKDVPAPYEYAVEWKEEYSEEDDITKLIPIKYATYYTPYKIVEDDVIPTDREFRNAWTIDDAELTDGVGGELSTFEELV